MNTESRPIMTPKNMRPPDDRNLVIWLPLDSARHAELMAEHWREIDRQRFGTKTRVELTKGSQPLVETVRPPKEGAWAKRGRRGGASGWIEPFRVHLGLRG